MTTLLDIIKRCHDMPAKNAIEHLKKWLTNARSNPVQIDGYETNAIALLINLTNKHDSTPFDCQKTARIALQESKFVHSTIGCIQGLISHSIKFSDAKYRGGILAYPHKKSTPSSTISRYVNSLTTQFIKPFDWCGNSANLSNKILFCTAFRWQERVLTLAEAIAEDIPEFTNALLQLGMREEDLQFAIKVSRDALQPRVPNGNSYKTLYFPRRHSQSPNDYLLITPVPSVAMQREIQRRTQRESQEEGRYIRTRRHQVGETKPLNVGDFYGSLSGYVTMFNGGFFNAKSFRLERALYWFLQGKIYWGRLPKKPKDTPSNPTHYDPYAFLFHFIATPHPKAHERKRIRGGFRHLLKSYLLAPHLEWAQLADQGELERPQAPWSDLHYFVFGQALTNDEHETSPHPTNQSKQTSQSNQIKQRCRELICSHTKSSLTKIIDAPLSAFHTELLYEAIDDIFALRFGESA